MNMKQVSRVSLRPQEVDAIVFWSKNPAPMIPYLGELHAMGFRYYFQFTLNDYPKELEPNIPSLDSRIETFLKLSRQINPLRVVWRYDPIIISNVTPFDFHRERFRSIAEELRGATNRVMVSIVDFYQKTDRRLAQLEGQGFLFDKEAEYSTEMVILLKDMANIARKQGMEIYTCAEARDYSEFGIPPGRCIDEELLRKIWVLQLKYKKDPSQREFCLCMVSKDIGINDTCIHGCPYCYSTRNYALAERRYKEHDPSAPALWGNSENSIESKIPVSEQIKLPI
jgi:DNA repair photolyase